ncbi:hypothetical protein [Pantoea agglomerans]|uniref:hypothetical protein n=1 Tax=Enterobacter agglomerans TaxID=549 RepID=UPI001912A1D6|nr:hypothetical protein [Pantoea agglomerans]
MAASTAVLSQNSALLNEPASEYTVLHRVPSLCITARITLVIINTTLMLSWMLNFQMFIRFSVITDPRKVSYWLMADLRQEVSDQQA